MSSPKFKNREDIEKCAASIARLMAAWGLKSSEWMIGKQMSFFFTRIITDPRKIVRDVNLYVLYNRLPWKPKPEARLLFPPKKSRYAQQYYQLQNQQSIGLDLMPIPDDYLRSNFITKKRLMVPVADWRINIESVEKFVYRLLALSKHFMKRPPDELREFYFADRKRYQERLRLYSRILKKVESSTTKKQLQTVILDYQVMMGRAYPELFGSQKLARTTHDVLRGTVAFSKTPTIVGQAVRYNPRTVYRPSKRNLIFVFSHFYPADTRILPLASAVVTEGGGLLSHAAIVCRENHIPCVVGVRGLTAAVKNNQKMKLNFKEGTLTIN